MLQISGQWFSLLLAALSGVLMALQGTLNASLSKVIGLVETTFIVHVIGCILLVLLLFVFNVGDGNLTAWRDAPWYSYLGGVISIFIIYLVAASIPKIGVCNATTAIIVGQVLTAVILDSIGFCSLNKLSFSWHQVAGIVFLAIGAKLLLRGL